MTDDEALCMLTRYTEALEHMATLSERLYNKHKAEKAELLIALERATDKLGAYVGVCKDDTELVNTILPLARTTLEKFRE